MIGKHSFGVLGAGPLWGILAVGFALTMLTAYNRVFAIGQTQSPIRSLANTQVDLGGSITYQGFVQDNGSPIDDSCDFTFALYDAVMAGSQLGATETETSVAVSEGRFTVSLNEAGQFGADAFNGQARWLQIALRCPAGSGSYTILTPRQPLVANPYALSLRPGATISGTVSLGILNLFNSWSDGLFVRYAGYNGVDVLEAGQHGVLLRSVAQDGVYVSVAGDEGVEILSAGDDGVSVNAAGGHGVRVGGAGEDGVLVFEAGNASTVVPSVLPNGFEVAGAEGHGLFVGRADLNGVSVNSAGFNGVDVGSASTGVYVDLAGGDGLWVNSAGLSGVLIESAGDDGLRVDEAGDDGALVISAGNPTLLNFSTNSNGYEVAGAGGNGLFVGRSDQSGVHVESAGWDGLAVNAAGGNGVRIFSAGTDVGDDGVQVDAAGGHGLLVSSAGRDGLFVDAAADDGVDVAGNNLAGFFFGDVQITGSCTGCTQSTFGLNGSEQRLVPGTIVALRGTRPTEVDSVPLLLEVGPALAGETVVGVVQGRAELMAVENPRPDEMGQRLVPREGAAEPGEYVTIIIYGLAQVQASAPDAPIIAGDRLTVSGTGAARRLETRELDGMIITEGAPTIGIALEGLAAGQDGLIWVLVGK